MTTRSTEEFKINNGKSSGSQYLQMRFFSLLLLIIVCFGGYLLYDEEYDPGLLYIAAFLGSIVISFALFITQKQVDKIVFEAKELRVTYSNLFGKKFKTRSDYSRVKYAYRKHRNDLIFGSKRLALYMGRNQGVIKLNTGSGGWSSNDISEITKLLVSRGVYNRYKFDKEGSLVSF